MFLAKMRHKYGLYRLFDAYQAICRNKLRKNIEDYLECGVYRRIFASDF